jgi:hypothetical protein
MPDTVAEPSLPDTQISSLHLSPLQKVGNEILFF